MRYLLRLMFGASLAVVLTTASQPAHAYGVFVEHNRCPADSRLGIRLKSRDGQWETIWYAIDKGREGTRLTASHGRRLDTGGSAIFLHFSVPGDHAVSIVRNRHWGQGETDSAGRPFLGYSDGGWFNFHLRFSCYRRPTEADVRTCNLATELYARLVKLQCEQRATEMAGATKSTLPTPIGVGDRERCIRQKLEKGPRHDTFNGLMSAATGNCETIVKSLRTELSAWGG